MVSPQRPAQSNGPILRETLRALSRQAPSILGALDFLLPNAAESVSFQGLRIQPVVAAHRNLVSAEPFVLPKERFGGSEDVPLVPLLRNVLDETLRAYATTSPHLLDHVGKTPVSPYGSMGLSVSRWGYIDWDYIRDMDWRIFLPPQLGHLSGFKSDLERTLTGELHKYELYPVLQGRDPQGLAQVQLRESGTGHVHGFHFFLIAMKEGFVRGHLHRDGGYSPHFAYFPEKSLDEHLEAASLQWFDVIEQQRRDYIDMFDQLSFNIFGENTTEDRKKKTRGWYLHKAFKWYAALARARGMSSLEEDLLYQYEHFRGSEEELSYLARYRYYARMAPSRPRLEDLDRDLARAASIVYARARNSQDSLVGKQISRENGEIILLETVAEDFVALARKLLDQARLARPDQFRGQPIPEHIRFADNLPAPCNGCLDDHQQAALIPAEWSMVFCDSYVRQVVKRAAEETRPILESDIRQALAVPLMLLLWTVSQACEESSNHVPDRL